MDAKKSFGRHLRAARRQRRLTQEDLADLLDRSVYAISNLERGRSLPNYETMHRLSNVLGIALGDLIAWTEEAGGNASGDGHHGAVSERAQLEAILRQVCRKLDERGLRIAIAQMTALAEHFVPQAQNDADGETRNQQHRKTGGEVGSGPLASDGNGD